VTIDSIDSFRHWHRKKTANPTRGRFFEEAATMLMVSPVVDVEGVATDKFDSILSVDLVLRLDLDEEERMGGVSSDSRALSSWSVVIRPIDER